MEPGILKVTEHERGEVEANSVKIGITVEGENFLYGNAAIEKCQEVKKTVEKLKTVEPEIGIYIKSVRVKSESGWFTKSSKGIYELELNLKTLAKVNEVMGVILDMSNVSMNSLEWIFEEDEIKLDLIKKAMVKAKKKADAMTAAVGQKVVGIRSCSDSYDIPNLNVTMRNSAPDLCDHKSMRARSRVVDSCMELSSADIGTEMRGKKEISAIASVEFLISKEGG